MIPELVSAAKSYGVGDSFVEALVGDFSAADWKVRDSAGHSPIWLLGHVATYRQRVLAMMGVEHPAEPWEAAFVRGTSPADVPADQDPRQLIQAFHAAHKAMAGRWDALTPEAMAKPFGRTLPDGSDTVGGALAFVAWHEAYHLGQLGFMRRLAGKPGRA